MKIEQSSWGLFLARASALTLMISVGVFVSVRLAMAVPGEPVRKALTVSGVLIGAPSASMATFRFYRLMGDAAPLCAPEVPIRDGMERDAATGAFSVEVPLDQSGRVCPDALFHDPSAYVEVLIGTTVVVTRRPINPVPYAVFAQQYGTPDCPVGYDRDSSESNIVLCRRCRGPGRFETCYDDVVRVGRGASAFWIDRYESSVWSDAQARAASRRGETGDDYETGSSPLPDNGQFAGNPLYALSTAGVLPSRFITWFQANETCFASGKRLPRGEEWLLAARGTPDPSTAEAGDGRERRCLTLAGAVAVTGGRLPTAGTIGCQSLWGAQDMIGNVWEWTTEWFVGPRTSSGAIEATWLSVGGDRVGGVSSGAVLGSAFQSNLPAANVRGGGYREGVGGGVFAMQSDSLPTNTAEGLGFRCVISR